ncbi:hypothetical protein FACS1894102_2560 [Spirochaetia bacterium]|nr:hypothetical protein FACS1894102_2560 [Spirochaetia bacterium]
MNKKLRSINVLFTFVFCAVSLTAQDFGFDDTGDAVDGGSKSPLAVSISGEAGTEVLGYVKDFEKAENASLEGGFRGKLNFAAEGANAKGIINLNIKTPNTNDDFFLSIDEAYLQAYFGDFEIETGIRKLTWGKADSNGPLDVLNPYDYRTFTNFTNIAENKIARPMIHPSYRIGSFSKIEAVFLPWFLPHLVLDNGRWSSFTMPVINPSDDDLKSLKYAGGGARFTTTIGSVDFGVQYFYGRMYIPAITGFSMVTPTVSGMMLDYNPYHQVGIDYAGVIAGFNLRAELAANISSDTGGDDGAVYNPSIAWSFGFDRDLFWGINLNLQCNESIRLMNSKVSDNPALDTEAGRDLTGTRISAVLSKKFLRDDLELNVKGIIGIEDRDYVIVPSIFWTIRDVKLECSAGVFGGGKDGQFGGYHDNSFVKLGIVYKF